MARGTFVIFALLAVAAQASTDESSPIAKVLSMIGDMQTKLIKEGEAAQKVYDEFTEYCEDTSRDVGYEIKSGKAEVEELQATIEKATSTITALATEVEELAGSIASGEKELADGTAIRKAEAADFAVEEKELVETIASLQRAVGVMDKSAAAGAFVQMKGAKGLAKAFSAVISATSLSVADGAKLTALVQSSSEEDDDEEETDAQSAAGKDEGIVELLENLLAKSDTQLADLRKKEESAKSAFGMTEQSLKQEIGYATRNLEKAKKDSAASAEAKATAEGDLAVSSKDLAADEEALSGLHNECMTKANDFQTETTSRGEELKALATAKKIIEEAVGGASLAQTSFLQVVSHNNSPANAAVNYMKRLAKKRHSAALGQLASRMASAVRIGAASHEKDVFAKLKTMINDMIAKLEKEAAEGATKKAYCDKEMSETSEKKEDKSADVKGLTTKIDSASAASAKLKEEVATLQSELAEMAASQTKLDKIRAEEKAVYDTAKPEMEKGLEGIKAALKVLNDYYAKAGGADAASGILSLLEVAEGDFTKGLSEMIQVEKMAEMEYKKATDENASTKLTKDKDVEYKTKEVASLEKTLTELTSDREGVQTELDAVLEYWAKIQDECVAKPEPYAEIKAKREEEIAGLKEGLEVLEGETALIQKRVQRRQLRGKARAPVFAQKKGACMDMCNEIHDELSQQECQSKCGEEVTYGTSETSLMCMTMCTDALGQKPEDCQHKC